MKSRKVTFIGVPLDLGAGRRGVDMGPSAIRGAEIHARVRELGYDVADHGDMEVSIAETRDPGDPKLKYLKEIRETCAALRDVVADVLAEGRMPIVLGGNSIAMGTIAGARVPARPPRTMGSSFRRHLDMNTRNHPQRKHPRQPCRRPRPRRKSLVGLAEPRGRGARAALLGRASVSGARQHQETGIVRHLRDI